MSERLPTTRLLDVSLAHSPGQRHAADFFTLTLALSVGPWLFSLRQPTTLQVFSPAHLQRDGLILAVTILLAVALWQDRQFRNRTTRLST